MFAPPVKAPKAKTASHAVPTRAPKPPQHMPWRPGLGSAEQMLTLQRAIGNQAMLRLLSQRAEGLIRSKSDGDHKEVNQAQVAGPEAAPGVLHSPGQPLDAASGTVQPKLAIGEVNHPLEREADQVAERVVRLPAPEQYVAAAPPRVGGKCADCEGQDARQLHAKAPGTSVGSGAEVPSMVQDVLHSAGRPLDASTRAYFEPRFGHDFSRVRIHADSLAAASARELNADAYTLGHDIVFGAGRFAPATHDGRRLIAHELTHVIQGVANPTIVRRSGGSPQTSPKRGSKILAKGIMVWELAGTEALWADEFRGGTNWALMQMAFTPYPSVGAKTITFLQTVVTKGEGGDAKPKIDIYRIGGQEKGGRGEYVPFYGAVWDPKTNKWMPATIGGSAPSSTTDRTAYLSDAPTGFPGKVRMFESVAVVPETAEILGSLTWGIGGGALLGAEPEDCTDRPTASLLVAIDDLYASPKQLGPVAERIENYDAIVDGFAANDGVPVYVGRGITMSGLQKAAILTADQEAKLDPIVAKVRGNPALIVEIGGFADATEMDPSKTSEQRARAVERYLVGQGVPNGNLSIVGFFGAAWARFPPSATEGRNRRVQLRLVPQ